MLICDLVRAYTEESGGVRTYIDQKREYIRRRTGHSHLLVIPGERDSVLSEGGHTRVTVAAPFLPGLKPYRIIVNVWKVAALLERFRPDLVEFESPYFLPWAARMYVHRAGAPLVGFFHTDFPTAYARLAATRLFGARAGAAAERWAARYAGLVYNRCDAAVTSTGLNVAKLRAYGVQRLEHIPLGVDPHVFRPRPPDPALRARYGISPRDFLLVYAGRLDPEKRIGVLVEAVERLPETLRPRLLLIGAGPLAAELDARREQSERLRVRPYLTDKEQLACHLAAADMYVTAGPYETFGLSVLEAQACGLPVVGVRAGALIDRVPPELGRLGEPDSAEQMVENIAHLAANGLRETGARARSYVLEHYSWERTFGDLFGLYERLVAARTAATSGRAVAG
ncbi:glycosyltransferase [bacterium]|nr:glycosyltransferase [bacterium]